jgi:hypothetical protein
MQSHAGTNPSTQSENDRTSKHDWKTHVHHERTADLNRNSVPTSLSESLTSSASSPSMPAFDFSFAFFCANCFASS